MLTLEQVSKTYDGKHAVVDGISLTLEPGVVGLVGHNGAGKTTLMQMLATLTRPSSGHIKLRGIDIVRKPEAMRQRLGYLPQDFGVPAQLTALEVMRYFAALKGVAHRQRPARLLEEVNLHGQAHQLAGSLSGGMRQRLGIAQALLNDPEVLIVDEPTAGLDPEERLRFRHLLQALGQHRLVLVSTHIVSDVEHMATQLAIVKQGRLVAYASPAALVAQAQGLVWEGEMDASDYDVPVHAHAHAHTRQPGPPWQLLQARRAGARVQLRVAHAVQPFAQARPCAPSLEEALMALRHAVPQGRPSE